MGTGRGSPFSVIRRHAVATEAPRYGKGALRDRVPAESRPRCP